MKEKYKHMYTPTQYARLKGVWRKTVYNWIHAEKVDYQKLKEGGYVIFDSKVKSK